jgi:hypothetical protein
MIDGDSQLRHAEDPFLSEVAGAYRVGAGNPFAGERQQEAAIDTHQFRRHIR